MGKKVGLEEAVDISEKARQQGKKIVTTNGIFDIFHIGHLNFLRKAKALGDILIVGVNSDSSTKKLKGEKRPINPENHRAELVAGLQCVDYVFIFNDEIPNQWLEKIKPDIHVKGSDRTMDQIIEKGVVENYQGKVVLLDLIEGTSTTKLIEKILEKYR